MAGIRRLILDVLIPLNLSTVDIAIRLANLKGVDAVDILVQEVERKVETTKITIEGTNIGYEEVKKLLDDMGTSLQSVDRVTSGKRIVG